MHPAEINFFLHLTQSSLSYPELSFYICSDTLDDRIAAVEQKIQDAEEDISKAEKEAEKARTEGNTAEVDYWRDKEAAFRIREQQLRVKEEQLRDEKARVEVQQQGTTLSSPLHVRSKGDWPEPGLLCILRMEQLSPQRLCHFAAARGAAGPINT